MGGKLVNVRLSSEDEQLAHKLRSHGISISDVLRRALRNEVRELETASTPVDTERVLEDMFQLYPTPPQSKKNRSDTIDATDRKAVADHIRKQLRARR
jgi:hypothetical protein